MPRGGRLWVSAWMLRWWPLVLRAPGSLLFALALAWVQVPVPVLGALPRYWWHPHRLAVRCLTASDVNLSWLP